MRVYRLNYTLLNSVLVGKTDLYSFEATAHCTKLLFDVDEVYLESGWGQLWQAVASKMSGRFAEVQRRLGQELGPWSLY